MIVYLGLYLVFAALGLSLRKTRQMGPLIVILLFLLWFMGWRYYVGCDFFGYLSRYENISPWASVADSPFQREGGFELLITFLKVNAFSFMWLNVIASALMLACYFRYFRVSQHPLLELSLLFPVIILQLSMSGIRQGIAVAMLTAAFAEFVKGRRLATGLWIVLAAQFHTSAAIFLPMVFLIGRELSLAKLIVAVVVLMPVSIYLMGRGVDDYTDQYVRQLYGDEGSGGAMLRYLLVLGPALYFVRYRKAYRELMPQWYSLFEVFSLATIFMAAGFLVSSLVVHRMTFYVMPISVMIAANAYRVAGKRSRAKFIRLAPSLIYGIYMVGWFSLSGHAAVCYLPYRSYSFI